MQFKIKSTVYDACGGTCEACGRPSLSLSPQNRLMQKAYLDLNILRISFSRIIDISLRSLRLIFESLKSIGSIGYSD